MMVIKYPQEKEISININIYSDVFPMIEQFMTIYPAVIDTFYDRILAND